jgi:monoamine oxidase
MNAKDETRPESGCLRRQFLKTAATSVLAVGVAVRRGAAFAQATRSAEDVFHIVIVGAGLAGLTAARDLSLSGCESFLVLEARNRVGGRTYNHDLGRGIVSEAAGQWIGPGQTAIADLGRELEIDTFDTYYKGDTIYLAGGRRVAQDLHGTIGANPTVAAKLSRLARDVPGGAPWKAPNAAELDKLSLGDWLTTQGLSADDRLSFDVAALLTDGAAPPKLGLLQYLSMINSANSDYGQLEDIKNGAQQTRFVGGSQLLSIRMARALGAKVRLSVPVRKIRGWDREVVEIETDREIVRARRVIMALSPPLCDQISFDPPLPEGRARLQKLWPTSPFRKTALVYSRPFWRENNLNGQIMQADGPLIWSFDNSPLDGAVGVIGAFVRPELLPVDPTGAERILSGICAQALGEKALHPIQYHELDWGKIDSWSLSCISPIPPGFWTKWGTYLHPAVGRLIWSGTETAEIYAGGMDGAVRSGHRAALYALNSLVQG